MVVKKVITIAIHTNINQEKGEKEMPKLGKKHFPYTKSGIKAYKKAKAKKRKKNNSKSIASIYEKILGGR